MPRYDPGSPPQGGLYAWLRTAAGRTAPVWLFLEIAAASPEFWWHTLLLPLKPPPRRNSALLHLVQAAPARKDLLRFHLTHKGRSPSVPGDLPAGQG